MWDDKKKSLQHNDLWCPSDACVNQKWQTITKQCWQNLQLFLEALSIMNALSHMHDDNTKENVNQWTDSYMNHFLTQDTDWKAWPEMEKPALMGILNNPGPL